MNPWHDVPVGEKAPDEINVIIEVPRSSTVKYELDLELGIIRVSHVLYPPVPYPGNYGFVPQTLDEDGDPLDMMVIMRERVSPLTLCRVRPIGVVRMTDNGENDHKILCVLLSDPVYESYNNFDDLPKYEQQELDWFFQEYQNFTHDEVSVQDIGNAASARETIENCMQLYREKVQKAN